MDAMDALRDAGQGIVRETRVRRQGSRRRFVLAAVTVALLAAACASAWIFLSSRHPGFTLRGYETAAVQRRSITSTGEFAGFVDYALSRAIETAAASEVVEVPVRAGDEVRAGQLLVRLRSPELEDAAAADEGLLARSRRARERRLLERQVESAAQAAAVTSAQARVDQGQDAAAAAAALFEKGLGTRVDRDRALAELAGAAAALDDARRRAAAAGPAFDLERAGLDQDIAEASSRLARDQEALAALSVRSPFAGTAIDVTVSAGAVVGAHAPLVTVADRSSAVVRFEIPERQAGLVAAGAAATILVGDGMFSGRVSSVAARASGATATTSAAVPAVAAFGDVPASVRAGVSASVRLTLGARSSALVLPRGAWLSAGNESWAYVARNGMAARVPIALGLQNAAEVEVTRGLQEGDVVIVSSYEEIGTRERISLAPGGGTR
jgi:HlyD family secretion protein